MQEMLPKVNHLSFIPHQNPYGSLNNMDTLDTLHNLDALDIYIGLIQAIS